MKFTQTLAKLFSFAVTLFAGIYWLSRYWNKIMDAAGQVREILESRAPREAPSPGAEAGEGAYAP